MAQQRIPYHVLLLVIILCTAPFVRSSLAIGLCCSDHNMPCHPYNPNEMAKCDSFCRGGCGNGRGGHCKVKSTNTCHCQC